MAFTFKDADGILWHQTNWYFDPDEAERAAEGMRQQGGFFDVSVRKSKRATHRDAWYVEYRLTDTKSSERVERKAKTRQGTVKRQRSRTRAEEEGNDYIFVPSDKPGEWTCFNPSSRQNYLMSAEWCSCPHYEENKELPGYACKHIEALKLRRASGCLETPCVMCRWLTEPSMLNKDGLCLECEEELLEAQKNA